jgi:HAD superfamily hydrolase (TIGR01450 family)
MTGNVALFRRMLVEEYRLHTKLFGPARFLLFPAFVAVLVGSGVYLLSLTGTSMGAVVAGLHALVVFFGLQVGTLGLVGRGAMRDVLGDVTLLAFSARTLPISWGRLLGAFLVKDLVYYATFFLTPLVLGFVPVALAGGFSPGQVGLLWVTLLWTFGLGTAGSIALVGLGTRSKIAFVAVVAGLTGFALLRGRALVGVTPYAVYTDPTPATAAIALVPLVVVTLLVPLLFEPATGGSTRRVRTDRYRTLQRVPGIDGPTARPLLEVARSSGSVWKVAFSLGVLFGVAALLLNRVAAATSINPSAGIAFGTLLGLGSFTTFNWVTQFDDPREYLRYPTGMDAVFGAKFRAHLALAAELNTDSDPLAGTNLADAFEDTTGEERLAVGREAIETDEAVTTEDGYCGRFFHNILVPVETRRAHDSFQIISRDITERQEREEALERQNERLERFASVVSHDLRNPLNVAQSSVELLGEDNDHVERIDRSLNRMGNIIEDVLTLARQDETADAPSPVDLGTVAEDAWWYVETGDATLTVVNGGRIEADASRLKELLTTLFRNAVEYGDASEMTVGGLNADGTRTGFYVADNGSGIPNDHYEEVFETGFSTARQGTGLGLSIAREIATAHGLALSVTETKPAARASRQRASRNGNCDRTDRQARVYRLRQRTQFVTGGIIIAPANTRVMGLNGAVVDLDGTVYRGGTLLDGARDGIDHLRDAGLSLLFFSNNPTKDGRTYVDHLSSLGIDARPGEAASAGDVTTSYLRGNHADDGVMVVGAEGLCDQLVDAGVRLTEEPAETDVLLGSWTPSFGYEDMNAALQAVDEATTFLGTDPDRTFPRENGGIEPGSGAIVNALAATVAREPDAILGKPSEQALALATERLGVPPADCLVVGDRLSTDLAMGARAGMTTVLVLTGVSDRADIATSPVEPDFVIDGLGDIDEVLRSFDA